MSASVLSYPDPNKEYLLETDASKLGLGAVLSQKQSDGRYHPMAFGSRALHGAEVNYHSTKLEFLAMKWSIKHSQTYLLGATSKSAQTIIPSPIFSHHQIWIPQSKDGYQKGKNNTMADALSRISEEWL